MCDAHYTVRFLHATEYVGKIAQELYPLRRDEGKRAHWQHEHCRKLKSDPGALDVLLGDAAHLSPRRTLSQKTYDGAMSKTRGSDTGSVQTRVRSGKIARDLFILYSETSFLRKIMPERLA